VGESGSVAPAFPYLVLVGLPGAGKSTIGRAVAKHLDAPFLDFDVEIARREGMSVEQIFARRGEPYFRSRERALTEELRGGGGMVLSPGGGWIAQPDVVALLRPPALLVHLVVSPAVAVRRMGRRVATRPLLRSADPVAALAALEARRRALYETADHEVNTELLDFQRVVSQVAELVTRRLPAYVTR
jgi:shikimate kinase